MAQAHPLSVLLREAAAGRFPEPDGTVTVVPPPSGRADAVVAFSGSFVVAGAIDERAVRDRLRPNDFSAPLSADFLVWLGDRLASLPGSLDAVLAATGPAYDGAMASLREAEASVTQARIARALRYRTDVTVWRDARGLGVVVLGRGLAGRLEVSVEVEPIARGRGLGAALLRGIRARVPSGEPLFAQVAPGNAASLRAFLAAGFVPIGAEVLFPRGSASQG